VPIFDTNDNFAKTIKSKVLQGFISACSIGFRVLAISEDKKDMVSGQKYPTITKSELYEVSLVDIPSNANAVKLRFDDNSLKHKFGL
jgi:HK97 family phage prohead protease